MKHGGLRTSKARAGYTIALTLSFSKASLRGFEDRATEVCCAGGVELDSDMTMVVVDCITAPPLQLDIK